jgi:hypothetical protein
VVFAVLSLVVRDPAFVRGDHDDSSSYSSSTSSSSSSSNSSSSSSSTGGAMNPYWLRYRAPLVPPLSKDRVKGLLPMLYLAKFDPNTAIAEVSESVSLISQFE